MPQIANLTPLLRTSAPSAEQRSGRLGERSVQAERPGEARMASATRTAAHSATEAVGNRALLPAAARRASILETVTPHSIRTYFERRAQSQAIGTHVAALRDALVGLERGDDYSTGKVQGCLRDVESSASPANQDFASILRGKALPESLRGLSDRSLQVLLANTERAQVSESLVPRKGFKDSEGRAVSSIDAKGIFPNWLLEELKGSISSILAERRQASPVAIEAFAGATLGPDDARRLAEITGKLGKGAALSTAEATERDALVEKLVKATTTTAEFSGEKPRPLYHSVTGFSFAHAVMHRLSSRFDRADSRFGGGTYFATDMRTTQGELEHHRHDMAWEPRYERVTLQYPKPQAGNILDLRNWPTALLDHHQSIAKAAKAEGKEGIAWNSLRGAGTNVVVWAQNRQEIMGAGREHMKHMPLGRTDQEHAENPIAPEVAGIPLNADFGGSPFDRGRPVEAAPAGPSRVREAAGYFSSFSPLKLGERILNAIAPSGQRPESKVRQALQATDAQIGELLLGLSAQQGAQDVARLLGSLPSTAAPVTTRGVDLGVVFSQRVLVHARKMNPEQLVALRTGVALAKASPPEAAAAVAFAKRLEAIGDTVDRELNLRLTENARTTLLPSLGPLLQSTATPELAKGVFAQLEAAASGLLNTHGHPPFSGGEKEMRAPALTLLKQTLGEAVKNETIAYGEVRRILELLPSPELSALIAKSEASIAGGNPGLIEKMAADIRAHSPREGGISNEMAAP